MLNTITELARNRLYWLAIFILCLSMIIVALYYQHVLDYRPCVICIHVRLWLAVIMGVAIIGWLNRYWQIAVLLHLLVTTVMLILIERSYVLLSTERGWAFGSCDFDLGLPAWFAIEQWWPTIFKVWEPCGYTPELLFGITMAEALMVMSVFLAAFSAILTIAAIVSRKNVTT